MRGISVLMGVVTLFTAANAQAGTYVGLDGSSLSVENSIDSDLNPRGMRVRLGVRVSEIFDLEAHLGGGRDSRTNAFDEFSAAYMGAFLKAYLPLGERTAVFGLAGVSGVELTQTINRSEFSDTRSGFSYGFGMETQLTDRMDLSADFVRYIDDQGQFSDISAVSLGIKWYF